MPDIELASKSFHNTIYKHILDTFPLINTCVNTTCFLNSQMVKITNELSINKRTKNYSVAMTLDTPAYLPRNDKQDVATLTFTITLFNIQR